MSFSIVFVRAVIGRFNYLRTSVQGTFSYALILSIFESSRFSFDLYFLHFRKTLSFANKTEAFLNHQSFQTASGFLSDAFQG
jgi:hypothetical protein